MDFSQIRYFLALAETLNFTRAAERCHVTQPTLTQAIRRLETELGGPLVHRDGRNTRLTRLGTTLLEDFRRIADTRERVARTARTLTTDGRVELNIGLMCTIGPTLLSGALERFRAARPDVMIVLHDCLPDAIPKMLLAGVLDGAFTASTDAPTPGLAWRALFVERMVVAFAEGHRFATADRVDLSDVAHEPYVDRLNCEFRTTFHDLAEAEGVGVRVAFASEREDWVQGVIARGTGVGVLPEFSVIASGLSVRPVADPRLRRTIAFATAERGPQGHPPALPDLVEALERHDWPGKTQVAVP